MVYYPNPTSLPPLFIPPAGTTPQWASLDKLLVAKKKSQNKSPPSPPPITWVTNSKPSPKRSGDQQTILTPSPSQTLTGLQTYQVGEQVVVNHATGSTINFSRLRTTAGGQKKAII